MGGFRAIVLAPCPFVSMQTSSRTPTPKLLPAMHPCTHTHTLTHAHARRHFLFCGHAGKTGSVIPTVLPPFDESFLIVVSIIVCSLCAEVAADWIDTGLSKVGRDTTSERTKHE
jgi:hypothetical protein